MPMENTDKDLYRIGTVASLTGISVERLRAWERRYDLAPAHKAGKTRFYSRPQLDRLKLIKHLIDQGQPISSLASLSMEQLQGRLEQDQSHTVIAPLHAPRIGLVGPNLLMLEQQALRGGVAPRVDVVSRWANMAAFQDEQTGTDDPSVLIIQTPVLSTQAVDSAKEFLPEARLIAIYQFATAKAVADVQQAGTPTLKWPVSWAEIEHLAISETGLPNQPGHAIARRYSDEELIAIAAGSDDPTNCPEYLIEAINQLNAFADYALDCAQAVDRPQLYANVHADATQARAQLEAALEALIEID